MGNDLRALVYSSSRKMHLRQFPTDNKNHSDNSNLLINRIQIPTVAPNTPDILTSADIFLILLNGLLESFWNQHLALSYVFPTTSESIQLEPNSATTF